MKNNDNNKGQSPPPEQQYPGQDKKEKNFKLTSKKEINATLEMVIRNLEQLTNNNKDDRKDNNQNNKTPYNGDNDKNCNCYNNILSRPEVDTFLICVDLFIFELDEKIVEKLLLCAILSLSLEKFLKHFKSNFIPFPSSSMEKLEKQLEKKAANIYNQFLLQVMNGIQTAENKKDYLKKLFQSLNLCCNNNENLYDLLTANLQHIIDQKDESTQNFQEIQQQLEQCIKNNAMVFLYQNFTSKLIEFQKAVGNKVVCIEEDLRFLSDEIVKLTGGNKDGNTGNGGLPKIAEALKNITSARFAEDDDFDEIFDAAEEIADAVEALAEIYKDRLKVLRALLPFAICPRLPFQPEKKPDNQYKTDP